MEILVIAAVLIIDQWSKAVVQFSTSLPIEVIPNYFYITYLKNEGAAWSMLAGKTVLLELIAFVAIGILLYGLLQVKKKKQRLLIIAYALLISGAAGNLIDRLRFGYVRDFFEWYPFHYSFPVFNVADVALTFGVVLLVIGVWLTEKKA